MQIISKIFASHDAALDALKAASPLFVSTDKDGGENLSPCGLDADGARFDVIVTPLTTPGVGTIPGPEMPDGSRLPDMPAPQTLTGEVQVDIYWQGATAPVIAGGVDMPAAATAFEPPLPDAPEFSPDAVKSECGRRIYGVASDNAQKNMLANIAAGLMSDDDKAIFSAGVEWIAEMQSTCRDLIGAQDATFAADAHWPAVPSGVAELATRF